MNKVNSEADTPAEEAFEKFLFDFTRENKLVAEILKSDEVITKLNQDALAKTKEKAEGIY